MSVDFIFKIAAIGMIVAVLNTLLVRSGREDQAMLTTLAGLIVVLMIIVQQIGQLLIKVGHGVTGFVQHRLVLAGENGTNRHNDSPSCVKIS